MRVLVLGGTRFVGPFALRALVEAGHDVTIFHRGHTEPDLPQSIRHVHGDFAAFGDHVDELRALAPEVVVDTVPYIDKAGHGVGHFVDVAERTVVLTSGDVYRAFARLLGSEPGPPDPVPLVEDSPLRTLPSPDRGAEIDYDNLEVEGAVEALARPVTVLRLAVVYGPGDPQRRLHGYLRRMDDRPLRSSSRSRSPSGAGAVSTRRMSARPSPSSSATGGAPAASTTSPLSGR
jgi:nucleoside-diphosphate-sugar epimerase